MKTDLIFKIVKPESHDYQKCVTLCEEILRKPLGLKFSAAELEEEKNHIRIAGFLNSELCATAMLVSEDDKFFMQRVAVKSDLQGKGIGSMLLKFCEELAHENEVKVIYCHARDSVGRSAVNFYLKNEYFCAGDEFEEDGIPHQMMIKILA